MPQLYQAHIGLEGISRHYRQSDARSLITDESASTARTGLTPFAMFSYIYYNTTVRTLISNLSVYNFNLKTSCKYIPTNTFDK